MPEPIDKLRALREDAENPKMQRQLSVFFLANGDTAAQVFYVAEDDTFEDSPYEWRITHADGVIEVINKRMVAYYRDRMIRVRVKQTTEDKA